jgi:hypothetical protein
MWPLARPAQESVWRRAAGADPGPGDLASGKTRKTCAEIHRLQAQVNQEQKEVPELQAQKRIGDGITLVGRRAAAVARALCK